MYGDQLAEWRKIRSDADPDGMFVGEWHRRFVMGDGPKLALEETEIARRNLWSGGVKVVGAVLGGEEKEGLSSSGHSSEDSFDHLRASDVTIKG